MATLLFATVQASANNEEQEEDLYLDPVQRTVAVLIVNSDKEGTGEKEKVEENSDWAVYFNEKGVLTAREITLKAGDNLKIKQNGTNFTYSLK